MQQHFVVPFGLFPFSAFEFFWFNFFVRIDLSKSQNVLSTFSRVLADVSIYATFHESAWKHFWTCLISVTRFGEILQVFGIFLRVYLLLGKMLSLLWQFCDIIGLIFIVENGQILKNNQTIWSHCFEVKRNWWDLCAKIQIRKHKIYLNISLGWLGSHEIKWLPAIGTCLQIQESYRLQNNKIDPSDQQCHA